MTEIKNTIGAALKGPVWLLAAVLAIASVVLHQQVDVIGEAGLEILASLLILLSCLLILVWYRLERRAVPVEKAPGSSFWILAGAAVLWCVLVCLASGKDLLGTLTTFPIFSEDVGWIEIATKICKGQRFFPLRPKSDFPSSIQAYPIALLYALGMSPLTGSRLTGLLYALCGWWFGMKLLREFLGSRCTLLSCSLFTVFSFCLAFYTLTGWHEITPVAMLIFAMWSYFVRLLRRGDSATAIVFGFWAGVSLWTLYTPALAAVIFLLLALSDRKLATRTRLRTLAVVILLVSPMIGKAIRTEGIEFNKHMLYYMHGGEYDNTRFSAERTPLRTYLQSVKGLGRELLPMPSSPSFEEMAALHPEPVMSLFMLIGLALAWRYVRPPLRSLYLPSLLLTGGVVLSNPTVWRESCLICPVIVFASIGLGIVTTAAQASRPRTVVWLLGAGIAALQLFFFQRNLPVFLKVTQECCGEGHLAVYVDEHYVKRGTVVVLPESLMTRQVLALSGGRKDRILTYLDEEALLPLIREGHTAFFLTWQDENSYTPFPRIRQAIQDEVLRADPVVAAPLVELHTLTPTTGRPINWPPPP